MYVRPAGIAKSFLLGSDLSDDANVVSERVFNCAFTGDNAVAAARPPSPLKRLRRLICMIVTSILGGSRAWSRRHRILHELNNVALKLGLCALVSVQSVPATISTRDNLT